MNNFDFFYVTAHSTSKRSLMGLGIPSEKIKKNVEWVKYSKYPKTSYEVTLSYFGVHDVGHQSARKMADEFVSNQQKSVGVNYYVGFHTSD
jgi:hypothetical protein